MGVQSPLGICGSLRDTWWAVCSQVSQKSHASVENSTDRFTDEDFMIAESWDVADGKLKLSWGIFNPLNFQLSPSFISDLISF